MAYYTTLYFSFLFSILLVVPSAESSRCLNKSTFLGLQLNSSILSEFNSSSNDSNNVTNQDCVVKLVIDFTTRLVNVIFDSQNQSFIPRNNLEVLTRILLNDITIKVNITYTCSMSDYCDHDFVSETLSSELAEIQLEPLQQKFIDRLYNPNNTNSIKCNNNISCSQKSSSCYGAYSRQNGTDGSKETIENGCINLDNEPPQLNLLQKYIPFTTYKWTDYGVFYCNVPNCGSNETIIEIFQLLTREYILPLNISIINLTRKTIEPIPTTIPMNILTTQSNYTSSLFKHYNILILFFLIILFLN